MTGEITLRGDVLPIGGLKEKVLAAKLAGIHTVIVPKLNRRDLVEIPDTIKKDLQFHFVEHMDEVLAIALIDEPSRKPRKPRKPWRPIIPRPLRCERADGRGRAASSPARKARPVALLGDDAAILPPAGPLAVTVDSQIAGVHFVPDLDPAHVARRLLAVNLSDLAAMGADPAWAFLALSAPPGFNHSRFFRAFTAACRRHGVTLAGGDLARCDRLVTTLTLIGTKPESRRWLHRKGAQPGHDLWLGGTVGSRPWAGC